MKASVNRMVQQSSPNEEDPGAGHCIGQSTAVENRKILGQFFAKQARLLAGGIDLETRYVGGGFSRG